MSAGGAPKSAARAGSDVAGLVGLIDRLEKLLNASELTEMEIEVGETALVLRKPGAFAAAVADLLDRPEEARRLADAAAKLAARRYSRAAYVRRTAEAYERLPVR